MPLFHKSYRLLDSFRHFQPAHDYGKPSSTKCRYCDFVTIWKLGCRCDDTHSIEFV
jgi:hypothetical protein